jgi:release factor glutamine methyltransferase
VTLSALLRQASERLIASGIEPGEARLEARLLAGHALGLTREALFLRQSDETDPARLEPLLVRREAREPLAYIIGERGFYGREFFVTPDVLIPRPETELLVEAVLNPPAPGWVLDIGTGSGCIAVTLACERPGAQVFATDLSESALKVARRNAERHEATVTFLQGDLLGPLPGGLLFDVIVSNPPYISFGEKNALSPEVLGEPHVALFDSEADGLGFYRRLATEAPAHLKPGGLLAVEVGQGQAERVAELWRDAGLEGVSVRNDLAGIGRVVLGSKK